MTQVDHSTYPLRLPHRISLVLDSPHAGTSAPQSSARLTRFAFLTTPIERQFWVVRKPKRGGLMPDMGR